MSANIIYHNSPIVNRFTTNCYAIQKILSRRPHLPLYRRFIIRYKIRFIFFPLIWHVIIRYKSQSPASTPSLPKFVQSRAHLYRVFVRMCVLTSHGSLLSKSRIVACDSRGPFVCVHTRSTRVNMLYNVFMCVLI